MLTMDRGGRETTLWHVQKEHFDKKLDISCLQIDLMQWITQSFVQNKIGKVLCWGFWTLWVKTEKNDQQNATRRNAERKYTNPKANF